MNIAEITLIMVTLGVPFWKLTKLSIPVMNICPKILKINGIVNGH